MGGSLIDTSFLHDTICLFKNQCRASSQAQRGMTRYFFIEALMRSAFTHTTSLSLEPSVKLKHDLLHYASVNANKAYVEYESFSLPTVPQTPFFKSTIKEIYQLTEDELERVNQKFYQSYYFLIDNIKINNSFLFNNENIAFDLLLLNGHTSNEALKKNLIQLQSTAPTSDFAKKLDHGKHAEAVAAILRNCLEQDAFYQNVMKVYFKIAQQEKENKPYALLNQKNYAYLTLIALELPVYLAGVAFALFCTLGGVIMGLLDFSFLAAMSIAIALVGIVCLDQSLKAAGYSSLTDGLQRYANFIDAVVMTLFNTQFYATEFAQILFDVQQEEKQDTTAKKQTPFSFFASAESSQTNPAEQEVAGLSLA